MSNTGRTKKLASFNCDQQMWSEFIAHCQEKGTTATATLTHFIKLYLDDSVDLDAIERNEEKRLDSLEQKISGITARMTQFESAILKIQDYLNNQPTRHQKSYNNSYYQQGSKSQPKRLTLTENELASRLKVDIETLRKVRSDARSSVEFFSWSKVKDPSGMGWEYNEKDQRYYVFQ